MSKGTIIFDLDGVLARDGETRPFVDIRPPDYAGFNSAAPHARPVPEMLAFAKAMHRQDYRVAVFTARSSDIFHSTRAWLDKWGMEFATLYMRSPAAENDTPAKAKKDMLEAEIELFGVPALAFDNEDENIKMYEARGITALRVQYD